MDLIVLIIKSIMKNRQKIKKNFSIYEDMIVNGG